jgi:hypothetical protein
MSIMDDEWNNKEYVLKEVIIYGSNLRFASSELQNNKELVLAAVLNDGVALAYASEELQNDKEIVLWAISKHGMALEWGSSELRNDYNTMKELFILAMKTFYNSHEYEEYNDNVLYNYILSEELKEELDYIKELYNCKNYKQVCRYIKRTDKIKKYSYRIPMLDTKFRFI